jgi:hypothetical protein
LIYKEIGEVFEEDYVELIKYAKWRLGKFNEYQCWLQSESCD